MNWNQLRKVEVLKVLEACLRDVIKFCHWIRKNVKESEKNFHVARIEKIKEEFIELNDKRE